MLAGGVWLEEMAAWLGIALPIKVLVNQLAVTERVAPVMRTVVGIASGLLSLKQYRAWHGGDRRRLAGQRRSAARRRELVPENLIGNMRLACHAMPALRKARPAQLAGFEAETADALPVAGPIPGIPDAFCGSVHSGYTSGPYMARLLADRILGREPAIRCFRWIVC